MAKITLQGHAFNTCGQLPAVGSVAPDFTGVKADLSELSLSQLKGKRVVLNIFPSMDTPVCAASVRRLNKEASSLENTRAVVIIDEEGRVAYTELVTEIADEPDYAAALNVLSR